MRIAPLLVLLAMMLPLSRAVATLSDEQRTLFFGHDQRQAIMDPTGWSWQAIGQVETASGNLCTATLISAHLALTGRPLCADAAGDGWVVPPSAAGEDFALIRLKHAFTALKPLQLWEGDREE